MSVYCKFNKKETEHGLRSSTLVTKHVDIITGKVPFEIRWKDVSF